MSPSCMIPEIAVPTIMLVIRVSMGVRCVAVCPPPVADISRLYDVTFFGSDFNVKPFLSTFHPHPEHLA